MNILPFLDKSFELYLTLERVHPARTYNYKARGLTNQPIIEATRHQQKCKIDESWMYIATPVGSQLSSLREYEKLYVGAQTQDRMFRGDGLNGNNYHHAEMRTGNGNDNPVSTLRSGKRINIHRISAMALIDNVTSRSELNFLMPLIKQPKTARKHIGYWFEQYVLFSEPGQWRWNTAPAERSIASVLNILPKT